MTTIKKSLIILSLCLISGMSFASEDLAREALIKNLTTRLQTLIKSSIEAEVFLDEDLGESIKLLKSSKITWADYYNEYPFVLTSQNGGEITLSRHLGFKASKEDKTLLLVKILFNIKRQLEGSRDFLPEFRMKIFAKKFSDYLFDSADSCTISIQELKTVHSSIRAELFQKITEKTAVRDYLYHSSRASWVLIVTGKESTDTGCRGNNRNIYRLEASLLNMRTSETKKLFTQEGTSCDFSDKHYKRSLKNFSKKLKNHIPKCTETLAF